MFRKVWICVENKVKGNMGMFEIRLNVSFGFFNFICDG